MADPNADLNADGSSFPPILLPETYITRPTRPMQVEPVTLEGEFVRLIPLSADHHAALCAVGLDPDLWHYFQSPVHTPEAMQASINVALAAQAAGTALPFVTYSRTHNQIVGATRYLNIDTANYHLEIGFTWLGKPWQRTAINTESKLLLLTHAFEQLGCLRVEFKTDSLNQRSRNAILRLGAAQEGIFRNHVIMSDGRLRHSVYFSIIAEEWSAVKHNLLAKLGRA